MRCLVAPLPLISVLYYAAMFARTYLIWGQIPQYVDIVPEVNALFSPVFLHLFWATLAASVVWPLLAPDPSELDAPCARDLDRLFWIGLAAFTFVLSVDPGGGVAWILD